MRRLGVATVKSEQISYCSGVSFVDFEQVNTGWESIVKILTSIHHMPHTSPTTCVSVVKVVQFPLILID